mmetsp:Transcript_26344/g.47268  ORF Transcript_26344/g.47268 Transcript_26344/m.47268 type:complete len:505 (+) Transcript_26344:1350-2864(+)
MKRVESHDLSTDLSYCSVVEQSVKHFKMSLKDLNVRGRSSSKSYVDTESDSLHKQAGNRSLSYAEQWTHHLDQVLAKPVPHMPEICDESARMVAERTRSNVFDRLYRTRNRSGSFEPIQTQEAPKKIKNDRIYLKGKLHKQRHIAWQERERLAKKLKTQCELRFNPNICVNSRHLAQHPTKPEESYNTLLQHKNELITNARVQKQAEDQAECSFSPKVSAKSRKIAKKFNRDKDLFSSLFEESFEREAKRKAQQISLKVTSQNERHLEVADISFIDRLVNSRKASEEKIFQKRSQLNALKDPETGQEFFKPAVGRAPFHPRNPNGLPIGSYLSTKSEPKPVSVNSSQSPRFMSPQSEKLLHNVKISRYHEIFEQLNPSDQGVIRAKSIVLEAIDPEALRVIKPVLEELAELDETLNFYEFSEAMDNLVEILTPTDKAKLFRLSKQTPPAPVFTHKPQIIETTLQLPSFMDRQQQFLEKRMKLYTDTRERKANIEISPWRGRVEG